MSTMTRTKDMSSLGLIAERYFEGVPAGRIAAESGLNPRLVTQRLAHIEALLLLLAHDFPVHLMARVTGLRPVEVHAYLDEIRDRIGDNEKVREHAERTRLLDAAGPDGEPRNRARSSAADVIPRRAEATKALEVLDFWASKWL